MRYWWVNHKQTFRHEFEGQYVWSPKRKRDGSRNRFYDFLREVVPGDVVFSYADGAVQGAGFAISYCYTCPRPAEFGHIAELWDVIGWQVDVRFRRFSQMIRPKAHLVVLEPLLAREAFARLRLSGDGQQHIYSTSISDLYLAEVERCDVYLGIFGYEYGQAGTRGVSPTESEYIHATTHRKTRLIYVWGADEARRSPGMKNLLRRVSAELVHRRVEDTNALNAEVYSSLVEYLDRKGALRVPRFDTSAGDGATIADLAPKRIAWFLETARRERAFPLKSNTSSEALLKHLNLLAHKRPTNAAILLFGSAPRRFHRTAKTKCVSCHGTEYRRPSASQQIYTGDLFEQADQAQDFLLSKINRAVGTRAPSITAPATYELQPDAVGEAIVNAIAHRDFHSHASVEVQLFVDRLEVWNPGTLPGTLTLDDLRQDYPLVPNNPLIGESLYLTRYIEKDRSGTQRMIDLCRDAGLPEPSFQLRQGSFVLTLWRDWLTTDALAGFGLSDRQLLAVAHVKRVGRITNADYRELAKTARKTSTRDRDSLVAKGVFRRVGQKRGSHYVLNARK